MKKEAKEPTLSPVREKEVSTGSCGSRRELRTLVFLSLAMAATGLVVSFQARKLIISEDIFLPKVEKCKPTVADQRLIVTHLCNNKTGSAPEASSFWTKPALQAWHSMSDEEVMWRASLVPHADDYPYQRTPKVAFMFLTKGKMPLRPLWEKFFGGHRGLFSVYLHTSPEYKDDAPESSVFFRRRIPSKRVEWGRATMIDAERRLLANALLDFSNERFVLLSESCIPLFNFTTIYSYLIHANQSFLGSFDDPRPMGRGRYNKRMWPTVTIHDWRKGSQWFEVNRRLAVEIVSDRKYYPLFRDHCRPSCYVDEHYLPTLVTKLFPQMNSGRCITWCDWSAGGSHPKSFGRKDVNEKLLNRIRFGSTCTYNGKNSLVCFLFARKFLAGALEPLLGTSPALLGF